MSGDFDTGPGADLAAKISPALVQALEDRQEAIIASSGGLVVRWAVRLIYPALLREAPHLAAVALDTVSRQFGEMSVNDFMAIFAARLRMLEAGGKP